MKKSFFIHIFLFLGFLSGINAQNYYRELGEASGFDTQEHLPYLEAAAKSLNDSMPEEFRSQFRVYTGGFYGFQDKYKDFGYPESFEYLKTKIPVNETPYYLLIGRESNSNGIFQRFWVEVKLPNFTSNSCGDSLSLFAKGLIEYKINQIRQLSPSANSYYESEKAGMDALANSLSLSIKCCNSSSSDSFSKCQLCDNPESIAAYLTGLNFRSIPIQNIGVDNFAGSPRPEILDYANLLFTINDRQAVDIPSNYANMIDSFLANGVTLKVFVTEDKNTCDVEWNQLVEETKNGTSDIIVWHHIYKGKSQLGDEMLFTQMFFPNGENENRAFNPYLMFLKGLGNAAASALFDGIIIYLTDESVYTWQDVLPKLDKWSIAGDFVTGLFGLSEKAADVASAITASFSETYEAAKTEPSPFSSNGDVVQSFCVSFVTNYIIDKVFQGAADQASDWAKKTRAKQANFDTDIFTFNTWKKLWGMTVENANRGVENRAGANWRFKIKEFVIDNVWYGFRKETDVDPDYHPTRGKLFEWIAYYSHFHGLGYDDLNKHKDNFPTFDYYNPNEKKLISYKTTIVSDKSKLMAKLKANGGEYSVPKLYEAHKNDGVKVVGNNGQNKDFPIESKPKIVLTVPCKNFATVQANITELMAEMKYIHPVDGEIAYITFFEIEIKTMESLIGSSRVCP
jgi:hypothetical protein